MRNKKYLNSAIGLIALVALVIVALAIYSNNPPHSAIPAAAQPPTSVRATMRVDLPTINPITTPTATVGSVSALTVKPISATAPTSAVGINLLFPWSESVPDVKIFQPGGLPLITQEVALRALLARQGVKDISSVSNNKVIANGEAITYKAFYGLVTIGGRRPGGPWAGSFLNVPLSNCTLDGKCTPTGKTLDHIENRPMWLFDFEITTPVSGIPCQPNIPCTPARNNNHSVDLLDAETLMFFGGFSYYQP
jgi:hypothetical protein